MHMLELRPSAKSGKRPYQSPAKHKGGRYQPYLPPVHKPATVRKISRSDYFRYDSIDVASPMGR